MLKATRQKIIYLFITVATVALLLGAPAAVPTAHADCQNSSSNSCSG